MLFILVITVAYLANKESTQVLPYIEKNDTQIALKLNLPTVDTEEKLKEIIGDTNKLRKYATKESISYDNTNDVKSTAKTEYSDVSNTNVQVNGVDEADIVKTDGKYIYSIGKEEIRIIDIQNSENVNKISSIAFERDEKTVYEPLELYIVDDKLIIITSITTLRTINKTTNSIAEYDIAPITNNLGILVYDVENKNEPKLNRQITIDGWYLSSRLIGTNFYIIANQYSTPMAYGYEIKYTRPSYTDSLLGETKTIDYNSIYYFPESSNNYYLNILSFDVNDNKEANIYSFLGAGNEIYMSFNNLYISNTKTKYTYGMRSSGAENTEVYKFGLNKNELEYKGIIKFQGRPINQFAMDEENGYFRVAVTNNTGDEHETISNVYVYDDKFNLVGKLEGLAKGERIYSVRFIQNKLYLVTYKTIDPLFAIDLSNPQEPKVLGQLKIPGVSQYLHPVDENHLVGIGMNTEEKNGRAVNKGMKISLFDISDSNNLTEQDKIEIGKEGTYSEIQYNHKLLYWDKEQNIIGFPINIIETGKRFGGAVFYKIDLENGITEIAKIDDNSNKDYNSKIQRIIYVKDKTYTISNNKIIMLNRNTLEKITSFEI